jgi:GAF domain-containing protein
MGGGSGMTDHSRAYHDLEEQVAARTGDLERRREVAEALSELLSVVNSTRTLDEILGAIMAQAARLLGSDGEALYLLDERDPHALRFHASRNLPPGSEPRILAVGTPVMGLAVERRRPVVAVELSDILGRPFAATVEEQVRDRGTYLELVCRGPSSVAHPNFRHANQLLAERFRSLLAVPLEARGTSHGSLELAYHDRQRAVGGGAGADRRLCGAGGARDRKRAPPGASRPRIRPGGATPG